MNYYLSRQPRSSKARRKDGRQLVILTAFGLAFLFALGALLSLTGCTKPAYSLTMRDAQHQHPQQTGTTYTGWVAHD